MVASRSMLGLRPAKAARSLRVLAGNIGNHRLQVLFHLDNIDQITVLIQAQGLEDQFHPIMMGVLAVFRSPVAADQIMPGAEFTPHSETVHAFSPCKNFTACLRMGVRR